MKLNRIVVGALIAVALFVAQNANAQGFGFFRGNCAGGVCQQRTGFGIFRGRVASYGAYQRGYVSYGSCANGTCSNGSCMTGACANGACIDGTCKINSLMPCAKVGEYIPVPPCEAVTNAPEPCDPVTTSAPEPCEPVTATPEPCEPVQTVQPCEPVQTIQPCEPVKTETCESCEQVTTQGYSYTATGSCPTGVCPTGACPLRVATNAAKTVVARTFEALALARINATRAAYGRPPLRLNRNLESRAYYQARYCASIGGLRHAGGVAEILAQSNSFDGAIGQWLRSAPHSALMLNSNYTEAGAAYYTDQYGRVWCAVQFR